MENMRRHDEDVRLDAHRRIPLWQSLGIMPRPGVQGCFLTECPLWRGICLIFEIESARAIVNHNEVVGVAHACNHWSSPSAVNRARAEEKERNDECDGRDDTSTDAYKLTFLHFFRPTPRVTGPSLRGYGAP